MTALRTLLQQLPFSTRSSTPCARHLRGAESAWSLATIARVFVCSLGLLALPSVSQAAINGVMAPLSLDFGTVPVGATSAAKTVSFVNTSIGMQIVTDTSNNGASSGDFAIGPCNGSGGISHTFINAGERCTYTVTFTPTAAGSRSGTLRFNADMSGEFSIPVTGTGITPASSIAIDPVVPATLYTALEGGGIYKSLDGGTNWSPAATQPANLRVKALVIKPGTSGNTATLFAASYGGGVFQSTDGGVNWNVACATQPANLNLLSLVMDASGKLYAGSEAGVFTSSDGCASWTAMNSGLPL